MNVYFVILSILLIFCFKNFVSFIVFKDKTFLGFAFILGILSSMIFMNRFFVASDEFSKTISNIGDMVNVTLMSGAVILFSNYFTKIKTIQPVTVLFFYFEVLISTVLIGVSFVSGYSQSMTFIVHTIVLIYSLILFGIVIYEVLNNYYDIDNIYWIRIATFILMQTSFLIMTFMKMMFFPVHILLYFGILIMILFIEIELLFKARDQVVFNSPFVNLEKIDEKDRQIVELLVRGEEYKGISTKTGLTYNTIKKYVHLIYKKYEVRNRGELINKVIKGE